MTAVKKLFIDRIGNFIPQRYVLGVLGLFALANSSTLRVALSMTITQMVKHVVVVHIEGETCPSYEDVYIQSFTDKTDGDNKDRDLNNSVRSFNELQDDYYRKDHNLYDWDESTQGILLSGFYYGYVITHLPGGLLAEKFGGKWTLGLGMLVASIASAMSPWAAKVGGATGLFLARLIIGLGQGPVTPALSLVMARWIPPSDMSTYSAVIFGGSELGNFVGPYLSGLMMADGGDWANVFYLFAVSGLVWFIFWVLLCFSTPDCHPFILESERLYLKERVQITQKNLPGVPWRAMLSSSPLWVLIIAAFGADWAIFTMGNDLPKYMSNVLKFDIRNAGLMSALPYMAMYLASFVFAALCDIGIRRNWHTVGTGRKIYASVCTLGPGVCIILASYSGCNRFMAVIFFILGMAMMGAFYSSVKINAMDIAPNYAGTVSALVNGIGAISGIITPYIVGVLTPDHTIEQWRLAFWVMVAALVSSNLVYWARGSGEQQSWDMVHEAKDKDGRQQVKKQVV